MADDVSILQEIDDALRADRVTQFWSRNGTFILVCCVLLVLSTAATSFWRSHQREQREALTAKLTQASLFSNDGRFDEAIALYTQIEQAKGPLGALAGLRHAQALISQHKPEPAIAQFNAVAASADAPDVYRDFAALEADILAHNQSPNGKPAQPAAGGQEARQPGRAFADSFAELDALRDNDSKRAQATLNGILNDKNAPFSERKRAAELMGALAGSAK